MLRGEPVDPQPANVHADGKFGRGVPSFESQSEYVTGAVGGLWGLRDQSWQGRKKQEYIALYVTLHKNYPW